MNAFRAKKQFDFAHNISRWLASRRPVKERVVLGQNNIYVFPSKAGFGFLALLLLMLVTAINYQNSLVYLMTFLLGAVFFVSIWLSFFNLLGLELEAGPSKRCFAGELSPFTIRIKHPEKRLFGLVVFDGEYFDQMIDLEPGQLLSLDILGKPVARGLARFKQFGVRSTFPFGLINVWTWVRLDLRVVVWPQPESAPTAVSCGGEEGDTQSVKGDAQPDNLRAYREGDSLAHVHWKKLASHDQLVVRDREGANAGATLRWEDYAHYGVERALRYLCFNVLEHEENKQPYALMMPGFESTLSLGEAHKRRCLDQLAMFGMAEDDRSAVLLGDGGNV